MMLLFGLGTLPAMLATSFGAQGLQTFLRRRGLKQMIAVLLIASGAWTLYITTAHTNHSLHSENEGHGRLHHSDIDH
jgi:sulfite exporter TauE/SafE